MLSPTRNPARISVFVRPFSARHVKGSITRAAVPKRNPTKKEGPLTATAIWTSRKVVPQIMVMATSASSALPKRTLICGWDAIGIEGPRCRSDLPRSEEHTSELQSLMRISYAVFCLKNKLRLNTKTRNQHNKLNKIISRCITQTTQDQSHEQ